MLGNMGRRAGKGDYGAVVVGSGPNGLAAAIALARAGVSTLVLEAADTFGGGARTRELTLPGFRHDVCSALHPLALASPFLRALPLGRFGLEWLQPPYPAAHPLDGGDAALLMRGVDDTATALGGDAAAYRRLFAPLTRDWDAIAAMVLGPPRLARLARHPVAGARFGLRALRSARALAEARFKGAGARALFAGVAAHGVTPLEWRASAAAGLLLQTAGHAVGWPMPKGGAQAIADAMAAYLRSLGGEVAAGTRVKSLDELPRSRVVMLDIGPRQLLGIAGDRLPPRRRRRMGAYRYGPGAFKVDWALDGPIPWDAPECADAATVHLGGSLEDIAAAEAAVWRGEAPDAPYVLVAQPTRFDPGRAPPGKHIAWAYCHTPNGCDIDMTDRIERQMERFAPGFRARVLARSVMPPAAMEAYNPNYVGGDIAGGANNLRQLIARPASPIAPYATGIDGAFLCSASTPPGAGVHGMCGYYAAQAALRYMRR